mgnify:CR=1 FL=1
MDEDNNSNNNASFKVKSNAFNFYGSTEDKRAELDNSLSIRGFLEDQSSLQKVESKVKVNSSSSKENTMFNSPMNKLQKLRPKKE